VTERRVYRGAGTKTFGKLGGFRNLLTWQRADDLADLVHRVTGRLGPGYYRLSNQMRGSAISVTGNIAEGYARGALGDYIRFCEIARASLAELGTYYLLNQLLRSLYKKRREGTWQRPIREPSSDYDVEPSLPSSGEEVAS
jgi:four helix bundle protein